MALQNKSGNIQMSRSIKSLKQSSVAPGNENILPGKSMATNVSKIPTRSVLGIVNANCVNKTSEFKKPTIPLQSTTIKNTLSTKFNSTSSLNQNVSLNSSAKPIIPQTRSSKGAAPKIPAPKVPGKQIIHAKRVLHRYDSTASLFSGANKEETNKTATQEIEKCEQDLNNVSLEEDVDKDDIGDPILLGDYVKDIYNYLFEQEALYTIRENYLMSDSPGGKRQILPRYRHILVDYMVDLQEQYKLFPETLYLAVYMLDKYLELEPSVTKSNLQCVGLTAMFLASKFEEIIMPDATEFASATENFVKVKDILAMEVLIVQTLGFNFSRPHAIAFLRRFSKISHADKNTHVYGKYFSELALNDYSLVHERPSKVAAAALYLANVVNETDMKSFWSRTLIHHTHYTEQDIMPVVCKLARAALANADEKTAKYRALKTKYSKTSYGRVSVSNALTCPSTALRSLAAKASSQH